MKKYAFAFERTPVSTLSGNWSFVAIFLVSILSFYGCDNDPQPFDPFAAGTYTSDLSDYYDKTIGEKSKTPSGKQAVYVDFSDGIFQAYSSEINKKTIDYIAVKMVEKNKVDWLGLGKKKYNGIGPLSYANDRDVYNQVVTKTSYTDLMAPIEDALKKIIASPNDALLITDFEEYTPDGKEQGFAYAKAHFIDWIKAGNTITFYYSPYTEKNGKSKITQTKNLYFVIFSYGKPGKGGLKDKFNEAIANRNLDLKSFEINPNPYTIANDYGGSTKHGLSPINVNSFAIGDESGNLQDYTNGSAGGRMFESFDFGLSMDVLRKEFDLPFAKKLFLNASNVKAYDLKSLKVVVSDVTADYSKFMWNKEALKDENRPKLDAMDEGNNKIWSDTDKNNIITAECYQENTPELKEEYKYVYETPSAIAEVFDYNSTIFRSHMKNTPDKVELITTFHKNFDASGFNSENGQQYFLLRVDYLIDEAEPNLTMNQLNDFKWNSVVDSKNGENRSLYESIRNTLQEVKPKGILYSYYIRVLQNI